jgi:hypothetical protein
MDEIFAAFHDLEMHVIVLCHAKKIYDEDTKILKAVFPDLTPRVRDAISGLLNLVAYVELKKVGTNFDQVMHFEPTGKWFAKNRMNLHDPITNPDFSQVFKEREPTSAP